VGQSIPDTPPVPVRIFAEVKPRYRLVERYMTVRTLDGEHIAAKKAGHVLRTHAKIFIHAEKFVDVLNIMIFFNFQSQQASPKSFGPKP
jgi:hypothetical protein